MLSPALPLDRRGFLKSLGGGLLLLLTAGEESYAQESGHGARSSQLPENVAAWLHIGRDGKITAFTGKVEVGQNIRTSLTQAVADELRCSPGTVNLVMGDTGLTPWDAGTYGSRTTPTMAPEFRQMASTARETLLDAAATAWRSPKNELTIANGSIKTRSGKSAGFGDLAAGIDWVHVIRREDSVTPAQNWTAAGTSLPKIDAHEFVTGNHRYTSDLKLPGMLYGRILRAPSFGAKLVSLNTDRLTRIHGATVIHDGDFAGVVASDEHTAAKAIASIDAKWQEQPQISQRELFSYIKRNSTDADEGRAAPHSAGSVKSGLQSAAKTLKSTYTVAYIAHVPLEPRAAVAEWKNGKLTVWTGTQCPFPVRAELAEAFGIPGEQVRVIVPDTGSAYGGKHSGECAVEAARLAKGAGRPVKLIWTREEEFTWAYFRPAGVIEVETGIAADGSLTAWEFHNYLSGPSGIDTPYEVSNRTVQFHPGKSPLREGSYRGLASTANHFARESHMDELAHAAGMDPLAFRLKNLKNERIRAVLQAAADRFGWSRNERVTNRGYGLACGTEKGGYVACCAEVAIGSGRQIRIGRIVAAWDCGAVVNPEHLRNQVEGAIVMGIGGALFEAVEFENGRILNPQLSKYRVPRFSDVPAIELVILDRKDVPSAGAGEIPIVGIAPAVANAVFNATGVRVRAMPILPSFVA